MSQFTLSCRFAQQTLESSSSISELHVRAHVSFTSNTSDRSYIPEVYDRWSHFSFHTSSEWRDDKSKGNRALLHHIGGCWDVVHG